MTQSSLQRHVLRCMVNYPNYEVCPYNALHRFRTKELLAEHMMACDSRDRAYALHEMVDKRDHQVAVHIGNSREFNLEFENWDKEYE